MAKQGCDCRVERCPYTRFNLVYNLASCKNGNEDSPVLVLSLLPAWGLALPDLCCELGCLRSSCGGFAYKWQQCLHFAACNRSQAIARENESSARWQRATKGEKVSSNFSDLLSFQHEMIVLKIVISHILEFQDKIWITCCEFHVISCCFKEQLDKSKVKVGF